MFAYHSKQFHKIKYFYWQRFFAIVLQHLDSSFYFIIQLLVYCVRDVGINGSDPAALIGRDKELRRERKESSVIHFTYFFVYISWITEENHNKPEHGTLLLHSRKKANATRTVVRPAGVITCCCTIKFNSQIGYLKKKKF
jgi:hypothetical protein